MSYLILVYTNPISEILDVVCYSDVYSSAPPKETNIMLWAVGPTYFGAVDPRGVVDRLGHLLWLVTSKAVGLRMEISNFAFDKP